MLAVSIDAATLFRLPRLKQISDALKLSVPDYIAINMEIDSITFNKGKVIHLRTNSLGDVDHIGYHLFPDSIRYLYRNLPIFDFLERYLLEIDLRLDEKSPELRMDLDQVIVTKGSFETLRDLSPYDNINIVIDEIPQKMYHLKISFNYQEVNMTFPSDCQLMLGGTIIDMENMFERDSKRMMSIFGNDIINEWDSNKMRNREGDIIIDGGHYLIDEIRGDLFFRRRNNRRELLFNKRSPIRSVSNILLTGIAPCELPLDLRMVKYGNKVDTIEISLQQYVAYCKSEGCKMYYGTKTVTDSVITGTLFAYNEKYSYTHMLSVSFPLAILDGEVSPIIGKAYVYIPLHDITEKYINKKTKKS